MSIFVLVHGSWHGGWCWERVTPLLRAAGHEVLAPDLPGHGPHAPPVERPYERYVPFVCDLLDEQPEPVVLVGHSSGGMIISEAARRRPDRLAALIYLAAFLLPAGKAPPDVMRDDTESLLPAALVVDRERQVVTVRPDRAPAVFYGDCSEQDAARATSLLIPEPLIPPDAAAAEPAPSVSAATPHVPRVYITCLQDRALGPAAQRRMFTALPCDRVYELSTSHSPFLSAPDRLAACLLERAKAASSPGSSPTA
jgi:pimeloyl-ACP methyl ester carboxylesterase